MKSDLKKCPNFKREDKLRQYASSDSFLDVLWIITSNVSGAHTCTGSGAGISSLHLSSKISSGTSCRVSLRVSCNFGDSLFVGTLFITDTLLGSACGIFGGVCGLGKITFSACDRNSRGSLVVEGAIGGLLYSLRSARVNTWPRLP